MRALFDTNVVIAAFVSEGLCARLLTRAARRHFELCTCPAVIEETTRVLVKKMRFSATDVQGVIALLSEVAVPAEPPGPVATVKGICRDPDDDRILACAVAQEVDYLVTGDADLLILRTFRKIRIVTPREFELLFGTLDL